MATTKNARPVGADLAFSAQADDASLAVKASVANVLVLSVQSSLLSR